MSDMLGTTDCRRQSTGGRSGQKFLRRYGATAHGRRQKFLRRYSGTAGVTNAGGSGKTPESIGSNRPRPVTS